MWALRCLFVVASLACVIDVFGYIEFVGARACVHAREKPGLYGCVRGMPARRDLKDP